MGLIDTHTHLETYARAGELPATLERARAAGVEAMITIGTGTDDWSTYRDLAGAHRGVHYSVGLHPCSVEANWADAVGQIEAFWDDAPPSSVRPVALGECGLDRFHLPKDPVDAEKIFAWQRDAFIAQLAMVKRLGCPLVVHSRGAFGECVDLIDASGVDWKQAVFHCFTEGENEVRQLMERGAFASFTGILTYKNAVPVRAAAKAQGLSRLMVETDAPYLTPMPHRGKTNEPAFLRHTAEYAAADIFGVSYDDLAETTTANARRFFRLTN